MQTVAFMTAGDGYWSNAERAVTITDMRLGYVADEKDFGELCVFFDTKTWDVNVDGLIYTDSDFLNELQLFLNMHGLAGSDVDYSEQGMQGDDYVSLDVGKAFLDSWADKFGQEAVDKEIV
jgi:hypothetical protein